jgi:hypothetical protein
MTNIKLKDLNSITGTDLFNDSESFMKELSEHELSLQGGLLFRSNPVLIGTGPIRIDPKNPLPKPVVIGLE